MSKRGKKQTKKMRRANVTAKRGVVPETWSPERIKDMLSDPIYGYGIWLQPSHVISLEVQRMCRILAEKQKTTGHQFSLEELDVLFSALFEDVVAQGLCTRGPDAPPLVSKALWLGAQQKSIAAIVRGEEP